MTHYTHNALRLGDNMANLHFLRKMAQRYPEERFIHAAHTIYLPQLVEMVCDLENLQVVSLETASDNERKGAAYWSMKPRYPSLDLWKNAGGIWERSPLSGDYAAFYLNFFDGAAHQMGLESPLKVSEDLLFDYPLIRSADVQIEPFDFLIVNSPPMSGQLRAFDAKAMEGLILELANKHRVVVTERVNIRGVACTSDYGLSVTGIGNLSLKCHKIIGVATGPLWATFNTSNVNSIDLRLILVDGEQINIAPNAEHAASVPAARAILKARGLL